MPLQDLRHLLFAIGFPLKKQIIIQNFEVKGKKHETKSHAIYEKVEGARCGQREGELQLGKRGRRVNINLQEIKSYHVVSSNLQPEKVQLHGLIPLSLFQL